MNSAVASAYPTARLTLARFTPRGLRRASGLRAAFTDLPRLADHLAKEGFNGYASLLDDDGHAVALAVLFEGRIVNAASEGSGPTWGAAALAELQRRYQAGLTLDLHELEAAAAHALSGVNDRIWKAQPGETFSGVRATGDGDIQLVSGGMVVTRVAAGFPDTGTFPAPLRPQPLSLPRPVGTWASGRYALTLRGRDAVNPITDVHQRVRTTHGRAGIDLLVQLGRGLTPQEAADLANREVADAEKQVEAFLQEGLIRREK